MQYLRVIKGGLLVGTFCILSVMPAFSIKHVSIQSSAASVVSWFQVSLLPAQRGELTRAAPRVVGEGEVGDGAKLEAFGERLQPVVVKMQRLDRRHASKRSVGELWGGGRTMNELLLWFFNHTHTHQWPPQR